MLAQICVGIVECESSSMDPRKWRGKKEMNAVTWTSICEHFV